MQLTLRLSGTAEELVLDTMSDLGLEKPKEIILDALALYAHARTQVAAGNKIGIKNKDGSFSPISTPTLRAYQEKHKIASEGES